MVERPPPPDLPTRRASWRTIRRSSVSFAAGLGLLIYEAVWATEVRPALLVVYVAMMGLPPVLAANETVKRIIERDEQR